MPPPLCLLLPEALGIGSGCVFRETYRDWGPGPYTPGLRGSESRLPRGKMAKWECREPEQTGPGRKEGWGQEAVGGKINRFRGREKLCAGGEERGREVPRKAQPLGLSLGCIFIRSRGCTDGLSIEFHLQHHQRLILYSLLILP